jgi:hypothetical protein
VDHDRTQLFSILHLAEDLELLEPRVEPEEKRRNGNDTLTSGAMTESTTTTPHKWH